MLTVEMSEMYLHRHRQPLPVNYLFLDNTLVKGQGGEFSKYLENWSTMLRAHDDHFMYCVDFHRLQL